MSTALGQISKRDLIKMSHEQVNAGRAMWQRTGQVGRLTRHSFNAEEMAPKTWIMCVNDKGEEMSFEVNGEVVGGVLECELYVQGRYSDPSEGVGMLHIQCPHCLNYLIVREDNKEMSVEYVPYRKAPPFLRKMFEKHLRMRGRRVEDELTVPVISSSEPWACDYCRSWGVRVHAGVATKDMSRMRPVTVDMATGRVVPLAEVPLPGRGVKLDL